MSLGLLLLSVGFLPFRLSHQGSPLSSLGPAHPALCVLLPGWFPTAHLRHPVVPFSCLLQPAFPRDSLLHQPHLRSPSFPWAAHAACPGIYSLPLLQTVPRRGSVVTGCPPALPAQGHMLCSWAPVHTSMCKPQGFGWARGTVTLLTLEGGSEDELRRGTHSSQHSDWPRVSPQ